VPLCAFGGWGLDLMAGAGTGARARRLRAAVVYVLFGAWTCTAYATYWIRRTDPGPLPALAAALDPAGLLARRHAAGSPADAELWLRRAAAATPDQPLAWLLLARTLGRVGEPGEEETALREALRAEPHSAPAHAQLAQLLARSGRPQEAAYHQRIAAELGQAAGPEATPPH